MVRRNIFESETVADLYFKRGFRDKAVAIYERLYKQNPHNQQLRDKLAELKPEVYRKKPQNINRSREKKLELLKKLQNQISQRRRD